MTPTPRIYIGSYNVAHGVAFGYEHSYLYFDPDSDDDQDPTTGTDMQIIRGGPDEGDGFITVEGAQDDEDSIDSFDEGAWGIKTPEDRNFRVLLEGPGASTVWSTMTTFATTLGTPHPSLANLYISPFDYGPLGPNSNSVINTVLNIANLDFRVSTPHVNGTSTPQNPIEFPAHLNFLDGSGDDSFFLHRYSGVDGGYKVHDYIGDDLFIIENGAKAEFFKTGGASNGDPNTVALLGYKLADLSLSESVGDMLVELAGATTLDSPAYIHSQFDVSDPLLITTLKVTGAGGHVIKAINLQAIAQSETSGELSEIYTAFDSTVVSLGNIVHGSALLDQTDRLFGLDGQNDILIGSLGDDIIKGRSGTDEYVWHLGDGSDTIHDDWADSDVLSLGAGLTRSMISLSTAGSDLKITISPGVYTSLTDPGYGGIITIKGEASSIGTFLASHVTGIVPDLATYVPATGGTITSTLPNETLFGFGTNDEMIGQGGDTLYGGGGDDKLSGASTQYGEDDNDWLSGGSIMHGGDGHDRIDASSGATIANGGIGNDTIIATGASGLSVDGGDDADYIKVDGGSFSVLGGSGNDIISVSATSSASVNAGDNDDIIHYRVNGSGATSTYTVSDGDDAIYRSYDWTVTLDFTGVTISDLVYVNERDLQITHSLGTLLLVGYTALDKNSWYILDASGTRLLDAEAATVDFSMSTTDVVFYGGSGNGVGNYALITTGSGNDYVEASDAGVEIQTGIGQDTIIGGTGNDEIYSGLDIDSLSGGDGDDELYGEEGDDILSGGDGSDTVDGGEGNDVIGGGAGANMVYGGDGNDAITVTGSGDWVYGGLGNDTITIAVGSFAHVIYGDDGNDTIIGNDSGLVVYAGDGDDVVTGSSQNDYVEGGAGNDIIDGGLGTNTIYGGDGDDEITVVTSSDSNTLYGEDGDDFLVGGSGSNAIYGGAGNDDLVGGGAMDQIYGGDGNDRITGGAGSDTLQGNAGIDEMYGDEGSDTIEGGDGNDTLYGGDDGDTIRGGNHADYLDGGDGNDYLYGENGDDNIQAGAGDDYVDAGGALTAAGNIISGGNGYDTLIGGGGKDVINGGADNDVIYGNGGNDTLEGGSGNDTISSGDGTDSLYGEDGDDTLRGNGTGLKTIHGGAGSDIIEVVSTTNSNFIQGGDGSDSIETDNGNDTIYGDDLLDPLATGNDIITSRGGNDIIFAGSGDDRVDAGAGSDLVWAEDGDDEVSGGDGADTIWGQDGNDVLFGGDDNDTLNGGAGNDSIEGGSGDDDMTGGTGNDTYYVDSTSDTVTESSGEGTDTVIAGVDWTLGSDVENLQLQGWTGYIGTGNALNNSIKGSSGDDTLDAAAGDDLIIFGLGTDIVTGGADADIFALEAGCLGSGIDTVCDFSAGDGDQLDLRGLLESYDPMTQAIADFVAYSVSGGDTTIAVDAAGTGSSYTALATLTGVALTGTVADLVTNGQLIVD